ARERAERLVDRAAERAAAEGRTVETIVDTGDPAETILDAVAEREVDHVVMGGHGGDSGSIARRLLGTVATAVVGGADVTVTVVRHDD
ncbi:universal stress protein, partial [Halorubrum tibetense]